MADLDTLRPEVRSALGAMVRADVCRDSVPTDAFDIIRAELLRLAGEVTELRAVCAATYQAAGCYGLPERFKDALSNAATGERIHDVDVDNLCPVDPVEWVERAEKAEAELAALKAKIAEAPIIHAEKTWRGTLFVSLPQHDVDLLDGKRVRLLVEDDDEH